MRVLHVTNAFPYPAVPEYGVFVKEQIEALVAAGVDCEVMFINGRAEGKSAYIAALRNLRARTRQFDVVHCHHIFTGLVAMLARVQTPVVMSVQNDWLREPEVGNRFAEHVLREMAVRFASRVIMKSPIPQKYRGHPKFVHLPNGVNYDAFATGDKAAARARLGLDPHATYALFVSSKDQFRPQKRYDRYRESLDILAARRPDLDVRDLIMVNQPREKVRDFFHSADLHLLCSDYEGSPNSVKEAVCSGTPVVATDVGNVSEMLEGVPGCRVATSFAPEELASLVEDVLAEAPHPSAVRDGFIAKGLSQQATTEKLKALYADVVRR